MAKFIPFLNSGMASMSNELTNFEILFSDDQDTTVVDKNSMFFSGNNYAL
jgi:hypothetical protein